MKIFSFVKIFSRSRSKNIQQNFFSYRRFWMIAIYTEFIFIIIVFLFHGYWLWTAGRVVEPAVEGSILETIDQKNLEHVLRFLDERRAKFNLLRSATSSSFLIDPSR